MYDHIVFVHEIRSSTRTCLEWDGVFQGKSISGATILVYDASGAIERIRLFHFPYKQLDAFSADLRAGNRWKRHRLTHFPGAHHENER
jgi:hypothetical protein